MNKASAFEAKTLLGGLRQRLRKGRRPWAENGHGIYSEAYTEGSDPFAQWVVIPWFNSEWDGFGLLKKLTEEAAKAGKGLKNYIVTRARVKE